MTILFQQLHFIVEVIVLVQTYLSPGQECLRSIVQQAIRNSRDNGGDNELISPLKVIHCDSDDITQETEIQYFSVILKTRKSRSTCLW